MRDEKDNNNEEFVDTIIKKGSKIKLDFNCKDSGSHLKYDFLWIFFYIRFSFEKNWNNE